MTMPTFDDAFDSLLADFRGFLTRQQVQSARGWPLELHSIATVYAACHAATLGKQPPFSRAGWNSFKASIEGRMRAILALDADRESGPGHSLASYSTSYFRYLSAFEDLPEPARSDALLAEVKGSDAMREQWRKQFSDLTTQADRNVIPNVWAAFEAPLKASTPTPKAREEAQAAASAPVPQGRKRPPAGAVSYVVTFIVANMIANVASSVGGSYVASSLSYEEAKSVGIQFQLMGISALVTTIVFAVVYGSSRALTGMTPTKAIPWIIGSVLVGSLLGMGQVYGVVSDAYGANEARNVAVQTFLYTAFGGFASTAAFALIFRRQT